MVVLKRKSFTRWQAAERLSDAVLCGAVREMEAALLSPIWAAICTSFELRAPEAVNVTATGRCYRHALEADMCSCTDIRKATRRISLMQKRKPCNLQARSFLT